jgi:flagellar protein FlaF
MAVAEIIGAAIGVMLLVIVAYLLVGSVLSTAEIVTTAQKDLTLQQEARLGTSISFSDGEKNFEGSDVLNFSVKNTGNEVISDFDHMDIYTWDGFAPEYQRYTYDKYLMGTPGNWSIIRYESDIVHPNQLDPGEKMWVWATFTGAYPIWFQMTTSNGVNAQTTIP